MKALYLFSVLFCLPGLAQNLSFKGSVMDEKTKTPAAFATVSLLNLKDSSFVKGDLTDTLGKFELVGLLPGRYFISIRSVEYSTLFSGPYELKEESRNLETLFLKTNDKLLSEVKITAVKQAFEQKFGNFIVNPDALVFKTSVDAVDILKRSPGVMIDGSGNIKYRGTSPKLLFDGKDLRMSADQEKAYLRSLTPTMIESIELMPSPPAKYESAWQTVINVKLKRDQTLGYLGSTYLNFRQGRFSNTNLGANITYKTKKMAYGLTAGLEDYTWWQQLIDSRVFTNGDIVNKIQGDNFLKMPTKGINLNGSVAYTVNAKNTIDFKITNGINQSLGFTEGTTSQQLYRIRPFTLKSTNQMKDLGNSLTGILGYKYAHKGRELIIETAMAKNTTDGSQNLKANKFYDGQFSSFSNQKNLQDASSNFKTLSLNYSQPVKTKHQFETGFKFNLVGNTAGIVYDTLKDADKQLFVKDLTRSNAFVFDEDIAMGFIQVNSQFKKLSTVFGLRAENTSTVGQSLTLDSTVNRSFWNFMPTVNVQYKIDENNSLSLAGTSKLRRPTVWQLNPFPFFIDPSTYALGNPFLKPTVRNNFETNYTHKSTTFTLSQSIVNNDVNQILIFEENTKSSNWQQMNIKKTYETQASIYAQHNIKKWWTSQLWSGLNYSSFNTEIKGKEAATQGFGYSLWNQHTFKLPKKWNLETSINYTAPSKASYFQYKAMYNWSLGLQRSFLKDKMSFQAYMNDILYTSNFYSTMVLPGTTNEFSNISDNRWLRLRISYNFGKSTYKSSGRKSSFDEDAARIKK